MLPGLIPSPTEGVWHIGPFPLRAYAFCILAGHRRRGVDRRAALAGPRR